MGLEVEAKIRVECSRLDEVEAKLHELGFTPEGDRIEVDTYYVHPCRDMVSRDEALRVRSVGGRLKLTYKGPRMDGLLKSRREIEVDVNGPIEELLAELGFKPGIIIEKARTSFTGDGVRVLLDRVKGLGCFIEVESLSGDPSKVIEFISLLGYSSSDVITESYAMMLAKRSNPL